MICKNLIKPKISDIISSELQMCAHNCGVQAAPQPRLCARLHLAARLELLLELGDLAVQRGGRSGAARGRGSGGGNRGGGRGRKSEATKAAQKAEKAAFLLKKYGAEGSRLAAQAAASAEEDVVCEGEKTREERDAELRDEAVSLDD